MEGLADGLLGWTVEPGETQLVAWDQGRAEVADAIAGDVFELGQHGRRIPIGSSTVRGVPLNQERGDGSSSDGRTLALPQGGANGGSPPINRRRSFRQVRTGDRRAACAT